ncbi:MAG: citrate synthase, partial [Clostridia bacterium]|nr:citrate synthase [Clostridia bacterium]
MKDYTNTLATYAGHIRQNNSIDPELYGKFDVKKGLRDINGNGVLAGLTEISEVCSHKIVNGEKVPCFGELYYRGINIEDIVNGFYSENRFGFEEVCYLLLFGTLPTKEEYKDFCRLLFDLAPLP